MSGLQSSGGIMLEFWLCFVPLFVAVDALGTLPIFISLTAGLDRARVRKVLWQLLLTATAVALAFLGVGKGIFALLGITVADFMIAGGSLLFLLSLRALQNCQLDLGGNRGDDRAQGDYELSELKILPVGLARDTG
jgi:small neutral amino acid transporter SnatA (MarC family)